MEADEINLDTTFEDLNADSLDVVELDDLEEEFDIEIPDEDAEKLEASEQLLNISKLKI